MLPAFASDVGRRWGTMTQYGGLVGSTVGTISLSNVGISASGLIAGGATIYTFAAGSGKLTFAGAGGHVTLVGAPSINSGAFVPRANEFRVNSQTASNQLESDVTALTTGGFVVVWKDENASGDGNGASVKGQRYDALGTPVGGEFLINTQTTGNQVTPKVSSLDGGGFVVTWSDASGVSDGSFSSVQAQIFGAAGNKIGTEFLVNTATISTQSGPDITRLTGGGFVVTWSDLNGIDVKVQVYDSSGGKVGGELLVNPQTAGLQLAPRIAGLADGGFVIAWQDTPVGQGWHSIKAQIYSAAGAKIGSEFPVDTATAGSKASPDLVGLSGGGFVAVWNDNVNSGNIKAQLFDAGGAKVGGELLVSTQTSSQSNPAVTALATGGFVVTWADLTNVLDGDIRAQVFNSTGTKYGAEFLVNSPAAAFQNFPAIAGLTDGGYVVTWSDFGATLGGSTNPDIKAVIYQPGPAAGTTGDDDILAPSGSSVVDGLGGTDTIRFAFKLTDASVSYVGNRVMIDGPGGIHTSLSGFEKYVFTDGTVNNADGDALVDDLFYYSKYRDVWNAHVDADAHYHLVGWHEGRDPNAFFSTSFYRALNPDVKAAGIDPLVHFHQVGWQEGRTPSLTFSLAKYLGANPDVAAAHTDPLWHFLAVGASEGRQPSAPSNLLKPNGFDAVYYLVNNPDVAAAGVDPFFHFQNVGWKEGRDPNALFDTSGYLATYTDVAAAHINPFDHYNAAGWKEGRDPSVNFDTSAYLGDLPGRRRREHQSTDALYRGRPAGGPLAVRRRCVGVIASGTAQPGGSRSELRHRAGVPHAQRDEGSSPG